MTEESIKLAENIENKCLMNLSDKMHVWRVKGVSENVQNTLYDITNVKMAQFSCCHCDAQKAISVSERL